MKTVFHFGKIWMRLLAVLVAVNMVATLMPIGAVSAADTTVITGNQVEINETITGGFTHPGVGLTKTTLETMRAEVLSQHEPWYSYYKAMTVSSASSKTVKAGNQSSSDSTKPSIVAFNSQGVEAVFIADSLKAYTQALMYYITGDETYRANALHIIRLWSQMDPGQYTPYQDAHIHTGIPLNRMVTAAEILRYSSYQTASLQWTDQDTDNFTNNLITPIIEKYQHNNNYFMNQHNYPLLGAIAGYIFTDNRARYNEAVEWFTVNKTALDQGFNGSVKQLFRLVDTNAMTGEKLAQPYVQHVEMGRDQAHGGGDLTNAAIISRMLLAQGTKVDPENGTVSTNSNAVGPYEFLNDRILAAANYFWQYMLGYDTPWTPVPYAISPDGAVRGIYQKLADSYRGRMLTANFWDLYYYYTYVKGVNIAEKAPYYYEAFTKRIPSNSYYKGSLKINWDNMDGGGDFWLYLPQAAEAEGATFLPKEQPSAALAEIEDRYTAYDNNTATKQEGTTSYVETKATAEGSKLVVQNMSYPDRTNSLLIGLKIRTSGVATLEFSKEVGSTPYNTLTLPDTKGQWQYITYDMGISHVSYGQVDPDYNLLYMKVKGDGTTVDFDHFNIQAGTQLTPPAFQAGSLDLNIVAYVGESVTLDFAATDSSATDVIAYELQNGPNGAQFNTSTSAFAWQPTQAGTTSFIVVVSDGTTAAAKNVNIVVASDRASAVQAAITPYQPNETYTTATLNQYNAVYNDTMNQIQTASDAAFYQQLLKLRSAAESLQLVTPLLSDESMDYTNIVTSTFGNSISLLVDNNNNTFPVAGLAPYPNLYHIMDFGPDYKVSATAFGIQGRMNFVDRSAGSVVFGSNDKENWTRLTPSEAPFIDDMATLAVDDANKNQQFRFIKIEEIHPQPDVIHNSVQNFLELGEFRIYGQRYETNNKIQSISIGSDQSVGGKIVIGNTAKVTIQAKEPIQNVQVSIQGKDAAVNTQDNLNWTATAVMDGSVQTGAVQFTVDYQRNDGTNGDTAFLTTDNSKLYLVDPVNFINVPMLATVTASHAQFPGTGLSKEQVGYLLFDSNTATYGDLNSGSGSYYTIDFGADASVKFNDIFLMPRASFPGRMDGMIVQGSNDNVNWKSLTSTAAGSQANAWTVLKVNGTSDQSYRYFRLYNSNAWYGNAAEVEFYGEYRATAAKLASTITSVEAPAQDAASLKLPTVPKGYTIAIKSATPAGIIGTDGAIAKPAADTFVSVVFSLTKTADGTTADTGSIATLVPGVTTAEKINVSTLATVIASDKQFPGTGLSKEQVGYLLFDGNIATYGDLNTGAGSYYTVDFGANASIKLSGIKLMPRALQSGRLNGLIVQGSNDNSSWSNLTQAVTAAKDNSWTEIRYDKLLNHNGYRYLRLYNSSAWFGNVAEVEFYGYYDFNAVSKVLAQDGYTKGSYYLYLKEIERINNSVIQPGADKAALLGDLYRAQGLLVAVNTIYPKITVTSSMVVASTSATDGKDAATNGWRAFDGNTSTFPDTTTAAGWARVDLGAGNVKVLGSIRYMPRNGQASRMNGALIQGSNDGSNFDTLYTISGVSDIKWYTQTITSSTAYRFLRYYTPNGFANVSEMEFYEKIVDRTLLTLLLTQADAVVADHYTAESYTSFQTVVTNAKSVAADATQTAVDAAADSLSTALNSLIYKIEPSVNPAAPNGLNGWYTIPVSITLSTYGNAEYNLNGEAAWLSYASPITLEQDGNYTLNYRLKDSATVQTIKVNIDRTAPADATFTTDNTPDNAKVAVTISYPDDAVMKEYKVGDNGTWTTYTEPCIVNDNETLYARGTDAAGNVSNVTSYTVSIIDKTPPADATFVVDITAPTNHDVSVTINYPADAAVKEYKLDASGTWTAYGAPVVVSGNVTVYAKATDAAGNVSNVTQYAVGNIDHIAPADAILAVDTTAPTNQGVTVTISFPADAALKEYKMGASGTWTAYAAPVVVSDNDTVYARGTDAVGNVSNVTSMTVSNIYKIAPVTAATLNPAAPNGKISWYTTDVTVSLSVYASVYGGAVTTEYQLNDGAWITYTGSIPAFGEGTYKFSYRSTDQAGNVEQLKTVEFKVDKSAPALTVQLDKTSIWPANHKIVTINAILNSSDAVSGVDSVVLTSITSNQPDSGKGDIQANFGTAATSFSLRAEKGRIYTINYTATDKAGNKTVTSVTVTVPHDQSGNGNNNQSGNH
ncbi:OmpL47-type beta-barrel domain-containing protein [Paenibacillus andongensis]|uniref:OmpL47-type beta-barrel domain-containing protein n=1 Tax=Paenibacillus andongensis TaxID=2975482 RepID=UPI0021BAEE3F|nr:discoidin domain-containing protein [Paenibacillus andongensis]